MMKQRIVDILEDTGYKESRAAKMDLNDILRYVCLSFSRVFTNVSLVDYCRHFMTLTFTSLECTTTHLPVLPSPLYQLLFFLHGFSQLFPARGIACFHLDHILRVQCICLTP